MLIVTRNAFQPVAAPKTLAALFFILILGLDAVIQRSCLYLRPCVPLPASPLSAFYLFLSTASALVLFIMNEKRREWKIIRDNGIVFVTAILPDQFPMHLGKIFQRIRFFRKFDLSTLYLSESPVSPKQIFWKDKITNHTKRSLQSQRIS